MLDPIQLPILMKAIDFVFEEGRKILEERRERRKAASAAQPKAKPQEEKTALLPPPEAIMASKTSLLASHIQGPLWQNHEAEVQHLVRLLETYSQNYALAKEQYAKWGSALVPAIVVHNMNEAESAMLETIQRLEGVLSKVYQIEISTTHES